jgi:hypothetical protein
MTNYIPRVLGSMSMRPGLGYIGTISAVGTSCRLLKFIFATDDTSILELTDLQLRIWINDVILTRPSVTSAVTNPTFATGPFTGWTKSAAPTAPTYTSSAAQLNGDGASGISSVEQTVTCLNTNVEHALRIVIDRGPVTFTCGTASGDDSYVSKTSLATGTHSLSFTPTGDFNIRFTSTLKNPVRITSCTIEASGIVTLPTPWGISDLQNVRYEQVGDRVFIACKDIQQYEIQRRGTRPAARGWSVVKYEVNDGPFLTQNLTPSTISASAISGGGVTLTASVPTFKSTNVGGLYFIESVGQKVSITTGVATTTTDEIRVTGISSARTITITITGIVTAGTSVDLQYSYDESSWVNVTGKHYTANTTTTYADGLDNQIIFYRLILTTVAGGDTPTMQLDFGAGSIRGICRVTAYSSTTSVTVDVLKNLGGTAASSTWGEGEWSTRQGWPTSVRIHEGRLWWAGKNGIWGSVSDAYTSFDETTVGDSGPLNRTIGSGPVDVINWLLSAKNLLFGAQGTEYACRASSLDELLTPSNFNMKVVGTQGSGSVEALKIDQSGYFVNRTNTKVYELQFDLRSYEYAAKDLLELIPEIGLPGIIRIDVQRQPDTRIHCVRSDGTVVLITLNKTEDMLAISLIMSAGAINDVVILPAKNGDLDDQVYYCVTQLDQDGAMNGDFLEKMAQDIDCRGDLPQCHIADSYVTYSGTPVSSLSGLTNLKNTRVVIWADGAEISGYNANPNLMALVDSSGNITMPGGIAYSDIVVGKPYLAQFKSGKLGFQDQKGTLLGQQKRLGHIAMLLANRTPNSVQFGPDFDTLDNLPGLIDSHTDSTWIADYDDAPVEFPGRFDVDMRICLQTQAPRAVTVMAIVYEAREDI